MTTRLEFRLLHALRKAAVTFRHYEKLHRDKGTEAGFAKAQVNGELAAEFEELLDLPPVSEEPPIQFHAIPDPTEPPSVEDTLLERGKSYGAFINNATVAQSLEDIIRASPNWGILRPDQREALGIICSKISRLLTGDPDHVDSWHDIAGYSRLVEKETLERKK